MAEWAGIVNTTAPKYLKGAEDLTIRNRLLLSKLKKDGRITFNNDGYNQIWTVECFQPPVEVAGDDGNIAFGRNDLYRQLTTDWRGYRATDKMTEKEMQMNRGTAAIVNRYGQILPNLTKSVTDRLSSEVYKDGSSDPNRLHGLETFMSQSSCVAADRIAKPSATYAGQSVAVGAQGGTWTSALAVSPNASIAKDWPNGSGDSEFDYLAPKLVNWSSTSWGTGSTSWADNCMRVLSQMHTWLTMTAGKEGAPKLDVMSANLFYDYKNTLYSKQRIQLNHPEALELGFSDVLNQDGVMVTADFDCPVNVGYSLNTDQMELGSLFSKLLQNHGPEWSIKDAAWLFLISFFGNCKYKPKYFGKFAAYA